MNKALDPDDMPSWLAGLWPRGQRPASIIAGVNEDDCAVVKWGGRFLIATTDYLNASPMALQLGIGTYWDLGRLVVAANLSDLCGSGARPVALLIAVTLPYGSTRADFTNFIRGVKFEGDLYGVPVIGGDSKLGKSRALLGVAIGSAQSRRELFLKNGAKPGDLIWVSGTLGSTAAAVWGYTRPELGKKWRSWAKKALVVPDLPLQISRNVSRARLGHGGTDISDGLGADLIDLCQASSVGAIINAVAIPVASEVTKAAALAAVPPWRFAFASGGDFQFIVTASKTAHNRMRRFGLHNIGVITNDRRLWLRQDTGELFPLPVKGHRDSRQLSFAEEIGTLISAPLATTLTPHDS